MIHIHKDPKNEPNTLKDYRSHTSNADYGGYTDRIREPRNDEEKAQKPLKEALCNEQKHRCCYCMRPISANSCSVEHYLPQSRPENYPKTYDAQKESLNYMNMLASCNDVIRNCSGIRGNIYLHIDPRKPECETVFRYSKDGKIAAKTLSDYEKDIKTLLLDREDLVKARKAVIDKVREELAKENFSESAKTKARKKWAVKAFSTVAIQYIDSKKELPRK